MTAPGTSNTASHNLAEPDTLDAIGVAIDGLTACQKDLVLQFLGAANSGAFYAAVALVTTRFPVPRPHCLPGCERLDGHDGRHPGACMKDGAELTAGLYEKE